MNTILVNNDNASLDLVKNCLSRADNLHLTGTCSSIKEALAIIKEDKSVELLILNLEGAELNNLNLLYTTADCPQLIIISSEKEFAADAFTHEVTDYLLKPFTYERFQKAVNKAHQRAGSYGVNTDDIEYIFVRHKGRLQRVDIKDVDYAEANADYINMVAGETKYVIHSSMKHMMDKLPSKKFIRVHRGYIVHLDKVRTLEENTLFMSTKGLTIPIGRLYKEKLMRRLNLV